MADAPRLKVKEYKYLNISLDDFEGPIDVAIKYLESLKEEGWTYLEEDYTYDGNPTLRAYVERPETDLELQERVKREEKMKIDQRGRRLQEYERLKKEFDSHG